MTYTQQVSPDHRTDDAHGTQVYCQWSCKWERVWRAGKARQESHPIPDEPIPCPEHRHYFSPDCPMCQEYRDKLRRNSAEALTLTDLFSENKEAYATPAE